MDTRNESEGSSLGPGRSFVVGCGIGSLLLVAVGLPVFLRARSREEARRAETLRLLEANAAAVRAHVKARGAPPPASGLGADWTGFDALEAALGKLARDDAWGSPFRYRAPGLVHAKGWDLWSFGPNGKDDSGTFDDLLVGED